MSISKSVGSGGSNLEMDVFYVQALLNYWRSKNGRAEIKVDGITGPKTIRAIEDFQRIKTGWVDGRVDANGRSIGVLEAEFEPFTREVKAYGLLALVLSFDPRFESPLNERFMVAAIESALREGVA